MAFIEKAIHSLISGEVDTYPMIAPQDKQPPFLTYQRISSEGFDDLQGPTGLDKAIIQIDAYGQSYNEAKTLARSVEGILRGYRGMVDGVRIGASSKQSERDLSEISNTLSEFRISTDYQIIFEE